MNKPPDDSIEARLREIVDTAGNAPLEIPDSLKGIGSSRHIDPTLEQRARALDLLGSEWMVGLVGLELADRQARLGEMVVEAEAAGDPTAVSTYEAALGFGYATWGYVTEAIYRGPEAPVYASAHWSVANAIAKHEYRPEPQD